MVAVILSTSKNLTQATSNSLLFKEHNSRRERHDQVLFLTRLPHADYNFDIHYPTIIVHNYPLLAALRPSISSHIPS